MSASIEAGPRPIRPIQLRTYERKKTMLQNDLIKLGLKEEDQGATLTMRRHLQLESAKAEMVVVDTFLTELTARKDQLS